MTTATWLQQATQSLQSAGVATARLDALVLLEDCLGIDRALILAHPDKQLTEEHKATLDDQIVRRTTHEPLAYIRGRTEFYGRDFVVAQQVLEPRPESETIIELCKEFIGSTFSTVIDIGTGSGALIITAKLELPHITAVGIDIDPSCLKIAQKNMEAYKTDITLIEGDLAAPLTEMSHANLEHYSLLCNLPYVPESFHINTSAGHEPRLAIFGGQDGLELYRRMFSQLDQLEHKPDHIITESMPPQHSGLSGIARAHGYTQSREDDFIQVFIPQ